MDVLKKQKEKYKTKSKKMKEILKKLKTSSTESQENRSFQDLNLKGQWYKSILHLKYTI